MRPTFCWTTFDVTKMLPPGWREDVRAAAADSDDRDFPRTPVISREAAGVQHVTGGRARADRVAASCRATRASTGLLPAAFGVEVTGSSVHAARDARYGTVLNVQRGAGMRFECHVGLQPADWSAVLHRPWAGRRG